VRLLTTIGWLALVLVASAARPLSWPQCEVRSGAKGAPAIVIDGTPFVPILFVGNNQFGRDEVLLDELRLAAREGIRLFGFGLKLDWHESDQEAAETIAQFCDAHPDGFFFVRIWLGPNQAWLMDHPDDVITKHDGERIPFASPSSEIWRADAGQQLRRRIEAVGNGPYARQFAGVIPTYLQTSEWFYKDADDFMDYSPANLAAFRVWLERTYRRNARLQDAWNEANVTFDTARFPAPDERDAAALGPFRDPRVSRAAIDMQRFQNELVAETIAYFARIVKDTTKGRALVGAFYGYTMELNGNGPRALAHSGHLALRSFLECRDIDMIHAPYSYFERALGQPAHLHLPVDSAALHGKLAVLEEDTYTHLAQMPADHLIAPGWRDQTQSLDETLAVNRRNGGLFLMHRCGVCVFDLLSDGRWNDKTFWDSTTLLRRMAAELRDSPVFEPQVAFVVDDDSVHYLCDTTHPVLLESLHRWRAELDRTGVPIGYYLQSDLIRLPDSIRVLILANPYHITVDQERAIRKYLNLGATVIWTFAPGIADDTGLSFERIAELTGIPVEAKSGQQPVAFRSELTPENQPVGDAPWPLRFVVTSEESLDVVARYQATGEVAAAARPYGGGVSLYTAVPRLPIGLLREIFQRAHVHLYRDQPGMTAIAGPYLIAHTEMGLPDDTMDEIVADARAERYHRFSWPTPPHQVIRLVPGTAGPLRPDEEGHWADRLAPGQTVIYRCE